MRVKPCYLLVCLIKADMEAGDGPGGDLITDDHRTLPYVQSCQQAGVMQGHSSVPGRWEGRGLTGDWGEYRDDQGYTYYHNATTGKSQYERPW